MKSFFSRWLPAIASTPTRKAALGVAGAALAGAALTGMAHPTAASAATPAPKAAIVAVAPATAAKAVAAVAPGAPAPAPATPGEKALGYDFKLQPNYYYCGPAATRIALSSVGQLNSFDDLAKQLGTTTDGTNSAIDIARVLNAHVGANVYKAVSIPNQSASAADMDALRVNVVHSIVGGHVVVANVIGTGTDLSGGQHSYDGGHYLTIVGYGAGGTTVKIADPADPQGDGSYWMSTINAANWIASRGYAG